MILCVIFLFISLVRHLVVLGGNTTRAVIVSIVHHAFH